ncbi:nucleoside diphosphate phosphatase ENTPD5 [Numenius arquata]|uniref:nucleoside diphosphate phosphatase ENTPD5 n=1 Tax=Numenius arquata TaxID=31919 RepID=UPI003D30B44E
MVSSRLLILLALAFSSLSFVLSHSNREMWFRDFFPPNVCPINAKANTFYGIMFDAGSTGTRIHIYTFVQKSPEDLPELEGEIFESVKPGLSAYADQPEKGAESVKRLLDVAIDAVPPHLWKKTPVVLKATAGLRLLSEEKAQALLLEVREVFEESPFLVPEDSVSIMDGSYEGILAWITVNFLTGQLSGQNQHTVGTLDLGGASTQITFLPRFEETLKETPGDFLTSFEMFNSTYKLYTHSAAAPGASHCSPGGPTGGSAGARPGPRRSEEPARGLTSRQPRERGSCRLPQPRKPEQRQLGAGVFPRLHRDRYRGCSVELQPDSP